MLLVYIRMLLEHLMTKFHPLQLHLLSITSQKSITPQTTKQATLESVISRKTSLHARLILATRIKTFFISQELHEPQRRQKGNAKHLCVQNC
jgi:hypothetical protein